VSFTKAYVAHTETPVERWVSPVEAREDRIHCTHSTHHTRNHPRQSDGGAKTRPTRDLWRDPIAGGGATEHSGGGSYRAS
jgi:hypothetical protein